VPGRSHFGSMKRRGRRVAPRSKNSGRGREKLPLRASREPVRRVVGSPNSAPNGRCPSALDDHPSCNSCVRLHGYHRRSSFRRRKRGVWWRAVEGRSKRRVANDGWHERSRRRSRRNGVGAASRSEWRRDDGVRWIWVGRNRARWNRVRRNRARWNRVWRNRIRWNRVWRNRIRWRGNRWSGDREWRRSRIGG
jgi:hypothetical protein